MALIKNQTIVEDDAFVFLSDEAELPSKEGKVVVSLKRFRAERDALIASSHEVGVLVGPEDDPSVLQGDFENLGLIAVDFPKFADGRGYSHARLLRDRYGWTGELRAVGDVLRDQLFYLARCGFDAFELVEGKDAQDALKAFAEYSVTYQTAADGRAPIYHQ